MPASAYPAIYGIPCRLRTARMRRAVAAVLRQIRARRPKDFERLRRLVLGIRPLSRRQEADGTLGEWRPCHADPDKPETWGYWLGDTPGVVYLSESPNGFDPLGVAAHEFGHACTTYEVRRRRGAVPFDEWREELAADWYAYQWGFGRTISRTRHLRDASHHGFAPGQTVATGCPNGQDVTLRITRNFCCRVIN